MSDRIGCYIGERVRVEDSDAVDDALVVTVDPPVDDPTIATLRFEISRPEAREIIQGLAAVL